MQDLGKSNHEISLDSVRTTELVKSINSVLQSMIFRNKKKNIKRLSSKKMKFWGKNITFFEENLDQVTLLEQETTNAILKD